MIKEQLMKKLSTFLFILFSSFIISINSFAAVNVVECEDKSGNRTFQKVCPPESKQVSEKKLTTGASSKKQNGNTNDIQATLYIIPDCEACEEIKEFLGNRNISITEKNVNDNLELQKELTALTGSLKVPTTVIGEEILTGYSRSKFIKVLESAGYKDNNS